MTQISGIKSEQGERSRASWTQMTNAKPMPSATAASSSPSQIWKRLRALVLFNIRSRAARPRAGRATAPRPSAWWDELRIQLIAGTGMALLFAGLAPALVMAALWHTAEIAPFIFTFTFAIALGHAVLLGLPRGARLCQSSCGRDRRAPRSFQHCSLQREAAGAERHLGGYARPFRSPGPY